MQLPSRLNSKEKALGFRELVELSRLTRNERSKLTPQAIRSWFNLLGGCFNWAVRADLIERNPTQGVKPTVRPNEEKRRKSFNNSDIKIIFGSTDYPSDRMLARYWLPLLALFTGARLNKLGQIIVEDVLIDPIPCLRVTDEGNSYGVTKTLKNVESRRMIPIHTRLIELGFIDFVSSVSGPHVFADLPHGGNYEPIKAFSQWFGRYLRAHEIIDPYKVFHSFRHTFKDECRRVGIEEEVHDALTGHSSSNHRVGRSYGSGVPIEALHHAMQRIHQDTLKIC